MKELPPVKRLAHAIALQAVNDYRTALGGADVEGRNCDCPQWYAWFCEILDEICKEKEIEKAHNKKERRKKK